MQNVLRKLLAPNGSVLIFSLLILAIILTASLSVISVAVSEKRSSLSTAKSTQSFSVSQSAVERTLRFINKTAAGGDTVNTLAGSVGGSCSGGTVSIPSLVGGSAALTFKDGASPAGDLVCTDLVSDIATIRSLGTSGGTSRVIETAVAATTGGLIMPCGSGYLVLTSGASVNFATGCIRGHETNSTADTDWVKDHCLIQNGSGSGVFVIHCYSSAL